MTNKIKLFSTITNQDYPFERIEEFADNGESLEVKIEGIEKAKIRDGKYLWERYADFLPFSKIDESISLGEGNTSLMKADKKLLDFVDLNNLYLKNETQNPTWSFKDRGSLACIAMAKEMKESVTATISTGNMGASISAFGAKSGIKVIVFVPDFTPKEKIMAMGIHGAIVVKIIAPDYSEIKKKVLSLAKKLNLRIVSGNGPIRVEGYKMASFELFEQMQRRVPDYIAVPTSACGHIRGIFKGYRELKEAGIITKLPKMIVVQAHNNSPIVSAIKQGKKQVIPFSNFHTIAEAITSGNPMGGDEIIDKVSKYGWLAEDVTEEEIIESQKRLAESGYFVEPASATSLFAIKKLKQAGKIEKDAFVVMILTGSGLKDSEVLQYQKANVQEIKLDKIESAISKIL
ncbi:threonine synthase [Gillisia sp. JM1]|uniref:threonine synthase n=1 Tax=Gillisia sp. JM1 TaxID=1283286 RepID=UPI00041D609F|nr:threonine synthase [Gillisia sp. JM1]